MVNELKKTILRAIAALSLSSAAGAQPMFPPLTSERFSEIAAPIVKGRESFRRACPAAAVAGRGRCR